MASGHRRHRREQRLPAAQHLNAGHRIRSRRRSPPPGRRTPAAAHARGTSGKCPAAPRSPRPPVRPVGLGGQFPQQRSPGTRHHTLAVRADLDPAPPAATPPQKCFPVTGHRSSSRSTFPYRQRTSSCLRLVSHVGVDTGLAGHGGRPKPGHHRCNNCPRGRTGEALGMLVLPNGDGPTGSRS